MKHFQRGDPWGSELGCGHLSIYLINIWERHRVLCLVLGIETSSEQGSQGICSHRPCRPVKKPHQSDTDQQGLETGELSV